MGIYTMNTLIRNHKGVILFYVMLISLALVIITVPLIAWTVHEFSWTNRSFMALRALNLADAGADISVWDFVHNNSTGWQGTISGFTDGAGDVMGDIDVNVQSTGMDTYIITSTGFVPNMTNPLVSRTVKVAVFPHPLFNNAAFGINSVTISGNTILDSFDSSVAPYSTETAGDQADAGTNGELVLSENGLVNGDVFLGPSGTVTGSIPAHVTGDMYNFGNEVELEPALLPDDFGNPPNLGDLSIGGLSVVVIPSGTYVYDNISVDGQAVLSLANGTRIYVQENITVGGQARISTNEDVEIYIGGDANFAGLGIVNTTGIADNLQVYCLTDGSTISYAGNSDFYGAVYAPNSTVYLGGNASYFGAVVGYDLTMTGNGSFHYDESLVSDGPTQGYDIAYWIEE